VVLPDHQQRVAITGSWCRKLPIAENALWRAQQGCTLFSDYMTDGDCFYEMSINTVNSVSESLSEIDEVKSD